MVGVRDRTAEFFSTATTFANLQSPPTSRRTSTKSLSPPKSQLESSTRVTQLSHSCIEDISNVREKIFQLRELSKQSSNFRDERTKIFRITNGIKDDMEHIKYNISTLKTASKENFQSGTDFGSHHISISKIIDSRFNRLAKSLADSIQESTQTLQKQKARRDKFDGRAGQKPLRKVQRNRFKRPSATGSEDDEKMPLMLAHSQSQQLVLRQADYQRTDEIMNIEKSLVQLSQSYQELAQLVHEQREHIITIDTNIGTTLEETNYGLAELQKYLNTLQGNRWLMIKVFAIIIMFALFFTLFVA